MINYIKGQIIEKTPTYAVLENNGIGYFINISLNTYSQMPDSGECKFLIHMVIKNEATTPVGLTMYGFLSDEERNVFLELISVSGVGYNTARLILSSMSPTEVQEAIISANVGLFKRVKGIGSKTAERVIVDLRDKFAKEGISKGFSIPSLNPAREEALAALVMLGFNKASVDKALDKLLKTQPNITVEDAVKQALQIL